MTRAEEPTFQRGPFGAIRFAVAVAALSIAASTGAQQPAGAVHAKETAAVRDNRALESLGPHTLLTPFVAVPPLRDTTPARVARTLEEAGLTVVEATACSDQKPTPGSFLGISPGSGERVLRRSKVTMSLSSGPCTHRAAGTATTPAAAGTAATPVVSAGPASVEPTTNDGSTPGNQAAAPTGAPDAGTDASPPSDAPKPHKERAPPPDGTDANGGDVRNAPPAPVDPPASAPEGERRSNALANVPWWTWLVATMVVLTLLSWWHRSRVRARTAKAPSPQAHAPTWQGRLRHGGVAMSGVRAPAFRIIVSCSLRRAEPPTYVEVAR